MLTGQDTLSVIKMMPANNDRVEISSRYKSIYVDAACRVFIKLAIEGSTFIKIDIDCRCVSNDVKN